MKVASSLLGNFAIAVPGSLPDLGDANLEIPAVVLNTLEPIFPTLKMSGSGATSESSISVAVGVNRTNQGASTGTLITFTKGLYEIDAHVITRYNYTAAPGSAPHSSLSLYEPSGSTANPLLPFYAFTGLQNGYRKFRVLFGQDGWNIRLVYGLTGVGENLDMMGTLHITKIL